MEGSAFPWLNLAGALNLLVAHRASLGGAFGLSSARASTATVGALGSLTSVVLVISVVASSGVSFSF